MTHPNVLTRDNTVLLVIDMQEPFLRNVFNRERVVRNCRLLIRAMTILTVPVVTTLQYGKRMGDVIPEIAEVLPDNERIDKLTFSCCRAEPFVEPLRRMRRNNVLVCGVESHICVNQTVHDLLYEDFRVHVAADAVSSRTEDNYRAGLLKMQQSGAIITSVETAIYELLHEAGTPEFKAVLELVK